MRTTFGIEIDPDEVWVPLDATDLTLTVKMKTSAPGNTLPKEEWEVTIANELDRLSAVSASPPPATKSLESSINLDIPKWGMQNIHTRGVVTRSNGGKWLSASLRLALSLKKQLPSTWNPPSGRKYLLNELLTGVRVCRHDTSFLLTTDATCDALLELLLRSDFRSGSQEAPSPQSGLSQFLRHPAKLGEIDGLVVFAGATGTGKTTIATGFALRYLHGRLLKTALSKASGEIQPPHLVTAEDPIESWKVYHESPPGQLMEHNLLSAPDSALKAGIWLTPRHVGHDHDVANMREVVRNALRQKPACVYLGEIRDDADWLLALELAATGHLVVCTTHASSLTEAFAKLAKAKGVKHPDDRNHLARSLRAVVQLKPFSEATEAKGAHPILWMNNEKAIAAYTAEGPSSLKPNNSFVIGRRRLLNRAKILDIDFFRGESFVPDEPKWVRVLDEARRYDLSNE